MADGGLGGRGVFIGRDSSGGAFCYDPWVLYGDGMLDDPNAIVLGKLGQGKSSLVKAVHAALVTETLNLADSLLHRAAKDIEAALFERVFDQLRGQLPELVDRVLREHTARAAAPGTAATTTDN